MTTLCVIAVGKELRDSMGYGTPDVFDAAATIFGGCALMAWLHIAARHLTGL